MNLVDPSCLLLKAFLFHFAADLLHTLYPELLKRLDDSNDDIRVFVTKTFLAFFK